MGEVTIAVATFGHPSWTELAQRRALPSARAQGVPVVYEHAETLHDARNGALAQVNTRWVIHLDADDELEPGYVEAMLAGTADVRAPRVRYVRPGIGEPEPRRVPVAGHTHDCVADCLVWGNWLVVGSMVRAQLVRDVGGWRDYAWSEDWDLWLRCHLAGATFESIDAAIYRAHVRWRSRNRSQSRAARLAAHRAIAEANGVPVP